MTRNVLFGCMLVALSIACSATKEQHKVSFLKVSGPNVVDQQGAPFFIKGTNLGNWLNPEGYMFAFGKTNSPNRINQMLCELVGPDYAADFWRRFKDNYITKDDIDFIASTGSNTIRLPFHYKLFTDEDYMGLTSKQDGFARIDSVVGWCRSNGLRLILDMHDAPGGQTGDNIDDSYGYPWLFESERSQKLFCSVWQKIASYYKDEPVILGYELINEPIAPYFDNMEQLNAKLEKVHKMAVAAIRQVDQKHIILLGGSQWNGNFTPFRDSKYDDNIMYTCHRYGGEPTKDAIKAFISFRDSVNLPMYMGEIGHNTDEWMSAFCEVLNNNNIGWTFWPYKKMDNSCFVGIEPPQNWNVVCAFAEALRTTFKEIRDARPSQNAAQMILDQFIEASKFKNCHIQQSYIEALGLKSK